MVPNRIYLRLNKGELEMIKAEAANHGLPVATLCKMKVFGQLERDRLAVVLERDAEQKEAEAQIWKHEVAAVVVIKGLVLKLAKETKIDIGQIESLAENYVSEMFTKK